MGDQTRNESDRASINNFSREAFRLFADFREAASCDTLELDLGFLNTGDEEVHTVHIDDTSGEILVVLSDEGEGPCSSGLDGGVEVRKLGIRAHEEVEELAFCATR